MDDNNRRAMQGGGDWRSQLSAESRQRIINKIMDSLKRRMPFSGEEGLTELKKISARFEEKIYNAATSQDDYLKKIYLKVLTVTNNQQSEQQIMSNLLQNGANHCQTQQQSRMMSQTQSQPVQLQQMMSHTQSQPVQLQKQVGLQHQLDRDMQQKIQTFPQKQFFQPQRAMVEASSTSLDTTAKNGDATAKNGNGNADGGDWQEEIYQKIMSMKDMYFLDLNNMYQKIVARLHQHESSLLQQPRLQQGKNPQMEKLKSFKGMLERLLSFLQISKSSVQIGYKEILGSYEKQIMSIINSNKPRKHVPPMQQGQSLPPPNMHPVQQSQPPQAQMTELQPRKNQMNSQMRSQNLQGSGGIMQQNVANLQHNPSSSLSRLSNAQLSMINSLQPSSALGPGRSNSMNSVQQVATRPLQQNSMSVPQQTMQQVASKPLQQNSMSVPQQTNVNFVASQSGTNTLQANRNSIQTSSSMLPQHLKQQEQFLQNQRSKQFQHRQMQQNQRSKQFQHPQMQQNIMQKQLMQQQQQFKQTKLQQPAQMQSNHSPMVDHMSHSTDPKTRQQVSVNSSAFQQHPSESQRSYHQQLKPGNQLPISSPQLLHPASPQIYHHGSPEVDTALNKAGTPLQPAITPSIVPSALSKAVTPLQPAITPSIVSSAPNKAGTPLQPAITPSIVPSALSKAGTPLQPAITPSIVSSALNKAGTPMQPAIAPSIVPSALNKANTPLQPTITPSIMPSALNKAGTPLQPAIAPSIVPSPSTPTLQSPMLGESEKVNPGVSSLSKAGNIGQETAGTLVSAQSLAIGTPGISASPLLDDFTSPEAHHSIPATTVSGKSNATEEPFERLIKVVKSMSSKALTASVCELGSVVSMIDNLAGSAPGNGSRAAVGEDLVEMTKCRLRGRNFITQDEITGTKKIKRCTTATPSNVVSSTAKKPRIEVNHALLEELREINFHLVDTVVNISDEDVDPATTAAAKERGEGTVVKCSFSAVALSPNLKLHYVSSQMSRIHPIRLLVPKNYPNCSPVLLDKFPVEVCNEDLSMKARSRFSISLRSLSQPMSIGDIAKTWDVCARDVISEYAQQRGGGSFSSKYGTWENCLTAA